MLSLYHEWPLTALISLLIFLPDFWLLSLDFSGRVIYFTLFIIYFVVLGLNLGDLELYFQPASPFENLNQKQGLAELPREA